MSTFIVADAHGRLDLIEGLLAKASASRGPDRCIVQLGDLANCVAGSISADLACLEAAPDLFDVLLVGNHEHPYFGGPAFAGFWRDPAVERAVLRLQYLAAYPAGSFIVTHAGLTHKWHRWNPDGWRDAGETAVILNEWWRGHSERAIFTAIHSARGGHHQSGGIFWADWSEPKTTAGMSQIVGHTPGPTVRVQGQREELTWEGGHPAYLEPDEPYVLCIDLGAALGTGGWPDGDRIAGCWVHDDDAVEVVTYEAGE